MSVPGSFAAIDFETTGSVAGYPVDPWQVGVVQVDAEGNRQCWESLLRVGPRPFHPQAPGRHEQIRDQLAVAPRLEECLPRLRKLCGGRMLLAHNTATEQKCLRDALPMERFGPWVDTLKLSRAAWPELRSHRLEDVLASLDLLPVMLEAFPERAAHDALYDAYGSAVIYQHLRQQPGWAEASEDLLCHPDQSAYRLHRGQTKKSSRG